MTPPQLFLIKEQIIIPFGFPFALFGNWKKVILTEATVLIFWLYLIRQTVCPKKIHFRGESWQVCLKRADIRTIFSLPIINKKKIFYFSFALPIYISRIKWSNHILEFSITILQKYEYEPPSPNPFRLEWYMSDMFRFCVQDSNQKKSQRTSWSSKKKILRKMTWNPNQSFVHRDYSKKSRLLSTTFSRYFTISNSNKIIPFFSSTTTPTQLFLPLFSVFGRHPVDCYYPHSVKN